MEVLVRVSSYCDATSLPKLKLVVQAWVSGGTTAPAPDSDWEFLRRCDGDDILKMCGKSESS